MSILNEIDQKDWFKQDFSSLKQMVYQKQVDLVQNKFPVNVFSEYQQLQYYHYLQWDNFVSLVDAFDKQTDPTSFIDLNVSYLKGLNTLSFESNPLVQDIDVLKKIYLHLQQKEPNEAKKELMNHNLKGNTSGIVQLLNNIGQQSTSMIFKEQLALFNELIKNEPLNSKTEGMVNPFYSPSAIKNIPPTQPQINEEEIISEMKDLTTKSIILGVTSGIFVWFFWGYIKKRKKKNKAVKN